MIRLRINSADVREITFVYTNYKGETETRRARPQEWFFRPTEWHPEPQWLLFAYDLDKKADRYFAVKDMTEVEFR